MFNERWIGLYFLAFGCQHVVMLTRFLTLKRKLNVPGVLFKKGSLKTILIKQLNQVCVTMSNATLTWFKSFTGAIKQ